jgi:uncharacterized protein YjgD (DUF1641 family)
MNPTNQQQIPPEMQKMIQEGQKAIQELTQKVQALEADKSIDQFNADTKRLQVEGDIANDQEKIRQDANTKLATHAMSVSQRANQAAQQPPRQG